MHCSLLSHSHKAQQHVVLLMRACTLVPHSQTTQQHVSLMHATLSLIRNSPHSSQLMNPSTPHHYDVRSKATNNHLTTLSPHCTLYTHNTCGRLHATMNSHPHASITRSETASMKHTASKARVNSQLDLPQGRFPDDKLTIPALTCS